MDDRDRPRTTPSLVAAMIIIAIGLILLLDRLGLAASASVFRYWPMLLVLVGVTHLFRRDRSSRFGGAIFLVAGIVLQLRGLGYLRLDWDTLWPFFIIAIGVMLLWRALESRRGVPEGAGSLSWLNGWVVFGGNKIRSDAKDFRGGEVLAVFGGSEIDLRKADFAENEVTLTVTALFGGIELRVPEHWRVVPKVTPILGGFDDKTCYPKPEAGGQEKVLVVRGFVAFGGVDIKN